MPLWYRDCADRCQTGGKHWR